LEIFAPILEEMERIGETLDESDFVDAGQRLIKTLDITRRNTVLSFTHQEPNTTQIYEDRTFIPAINPKSKKIASQTGER
jgi:hypothetical protein